MKFNWQLAPEGKLNFPAGDLHLSPLVEKLLVNRGLTERVAVREFLTPDYNQDVPDPFLFADMRKVVERIYKAIDQSENIALYGDYDADGVCSSVVLATTLQALGAIVKDVYLPHREREGYGLNIPAVKLLAEQGVTLLITLDCGTTNIQEILAAKELGMDVIVIDHHHVPTELPGAFALLNPKMPNESYPFKFLASVGMAFKVAQGLLAKKIQSEPEAREDWQNFEKWLLDLVAIATVTDMVPLYGENRTLLKYGLVVINKTRRPGLKSLIEVMGDKFGNIDAASLGWRIGPRINAAGRMSHANTAYALLMANEPTEAKELALKLNAENTERQKLTEVMTASAIAQLDVQPDRQVLVAMGEDWPVGLVGLVAGRLVERYGRPVFVATRTPFGVAGSGRSIPAFNIIEALHALPNLFTKFGGHAQACGFTLKPEIEISTLASQLNDLAAKQLKPEDFTKKLIIDAILRLADVQWSTWSDISTFEPYGMNNPAPIFLFKALKVVGLNRLGSTNQHLKLTVADEQGGIRQALGWRLAESWPNLQIGEIIDLVAELSVNDWRDHKDLQLKIIDLRLSVNN